MGASNVGTVFVRWGHLNHVPFRVLTYMAHVSLDRDSPPRYWGGRDALVTIALGRELPPAPERTDSSAEAERVRKARRRAFEAVKEALRDLQEQGAIKLVATGYSGRNSEYELQLERQVQTPPSEQGQTPPNRQAQTPPSTGSSCRSGGSETPSEEDAGGQRTEVGGDAVGASPYLPEADRSAEEGDLRPRLAAQDICEHDRSARSCMDCWVYVEFAAAEAV